MYVSSLSNNGLLLWDENGNELNSILSSKVNQSASIFIVKTGEIYVDNGDMARRVEKWTWNTTERTPIMNVASRCRSLFVDTNNALYCSQDQQHQVVKVFLNRSPYKFIVAAGRRGWSGRKAYRLNSPKGIFVDLKFNLYVADKWNNRIQRFRPGNLRGTTVAGRGVPMGLTLNAPNAVILDADGYLFIADQHNNRIIRSGSHNYRCLVGCSNSNKPPFYQLNRPISISFDSHGNIFSIDGSRNRILKFDLITKYCGKLMMIFFKDALDLKITSPPLNNDFGNIHHIIFFQVCHIINQNCLHVLCGIPKRSTSLIARQLAILPSACLSTPIILFTLQLIL